MFSVIYAEYTQMFQNPLVLIFFTCIFADFVTGLVSAWYTKTLDSRVGIRGTIRHGMLATVFILFYPYLGVFN